MLRRLIGSAWEDRAESFLHKRGLKSRIKNFTSRWGEIDLIMDDGEYLVFIEVRFRTRNNYGSALETIDRRKQRRIIRSAQYYLARFPELGYRPCRFDVIAIGGNGAAGEYTWIKDAFPAA